MKVYVEQKDIERLITYHNGANTEQGLYVYGKDKIEVLSLTDYTEQVRKETIEEVLQTINNNFNCLGYIEDIEFEEFKKKLLDQIQGESK